MAEQLFSEAHMIENAREYIERLAFGFNDDNTCSAISAAMALNYLSLQYKRDFVPPGRRAEKRKETVPMGALQVRADYPATYALHRYFVEKCDMKAVSYGDKITVPFRYYLENTEGIDRGIELSWTLFPKASTIKANIDANLPVLITTTLAGKLSWHTMVCYGYREREGGGGMQLLVHNGWYGAEDTVWDPADGTAAQKGTWVDKKIATYGYYFKL
ncbi:MAG: hypothetical protein J5712_07295 [Lachnospiraceae bacterium]|nr:hypothetical protein [Lachnospiraceae bacterium]